LTARQALEHPNWSMGNKITIDSATMMNKGFEVIEAFWLFGVKKEKIDVIIHPQSIVHSMVQFIDGSIKAQLGLPDMRLPISFAINFPKRYKFDFPRLNLAQMKSLEFITPDYDKFPCLKIAFKVLEIGGTAPAIINAANEVAVNHFLNSEISFLDIHKSIENSLEEMKVIKNPSIEDIIETDKETRQITKKFINSLKKHYGMVK
jgi:1-deoxy-D-xylulose-5-phosphate reductoisomerase